MKELVCKVAFGFVISMNCAYGAVTSGTNATIQEIYSYAQIGAKGDVVFTVNDPAPGCTGFWLDSTSPGFNNNLSFLLSAYYANTQVLIYADETEKFSGSASSYCKVTIVRLRPKS